MLPEQTTPRSFPRALSFSIIFVVLLWFIHGLSILFDVSLWSLGISAQKTAGLPGVIFAPLIHGDWSHLASNSPALITLGATIFYGYPRAAKWAIIGIWLGGDLLTWWFARPDVYHFGASGLTHGLMFFLFTIGVIRGDRLSIALAMIVFFLYGSMIWSIFPNEPGISFEMHLFGGLAGVFMAVVLKNLDVALPRKHYEWEDEEEISDDVFNADEWMQDREAKESPLVIHDSLPEDKR